MRYTSDYGTSNLTIMAIQDIDGETSPFQATRKIKGPLVTELDLYFERLVHRDCD